MRYKVYFDSNVYISASVLAASKDLKIKIKHPFAEISIRLLDFIKKHMRKRIGIVTYLVEEEARFVLRDAVKSQLAEEVKDRKVDFEVFSAILNICENRLREFLQYCIREPVEEEDITPIYDQVFNMYAELMKEAIKLPNPAGFRSSLSPRQIRRLAYNLYKSQDEKENAQLLHLIRKPVEDSDMRILSHAVYLLNTFIQSEGAAIRFFLASCDYHFSPIRRDPIISKQVTEYIDQRFGIECDFPDQIFFYLNRKL